jgi:hypothetical protein
MNGWTQALIEHMRTRAKSRMPMLGPVNILSETKGLGKSWLIGYAYPSKDHDGPMTIMGIALVAPSAFFKKRLTGKEWDIWSSTGARAVQSSTMQIVCEQMCGLWFTLGQTLDTQVVKLHLKTASGKMIESEIQNTNFVLITDDDPRPFEVQTITELGVERERFEFPFQYPGKEDKTLPLS